MGAQLVASRLRKHRDQWNAVQTSKNVRLDRVETSGDISSVLSQVHGTRRVDNVWDVPVRPDLEDDLSFCRACVLFSWFEGSRSLAVSSLRTCLLVSPPFRAERGMFDSTSTEYQAYTSDMSRSKYECIVHDDKKKMSMWKVPCMFYQLLLFHFACISSSWQANQWCHSCLQILLPPSLEKFLGFHVFATIMVVPYFYGTIKSKCFSPLGHTCKKLGHSCLRKVVSFSAWPLRKRWRFLHRALEAAWFLRVWVMRSGH